MSYKKKGYMQIISIIPLVRLKNLLRILIEDNNFCKGRKIVAIITF